MRAMKVLVMLALVVGLALPGSAEDKPAKKKGGAQQNFVASQMLKTLEPAKLTEDQVAKVKELAGKAQAESMQIKKDAGITADMNKTRQEAMKKAREEGKKGKDLQAAGDAALNLTEDQKAASKKADEVLAKCRQSVFALLSDDQKAALPEQVQKSMKGPAEKGAPKKKKNAA